MQDVFIKQTVYRLSQIQEAELVNSEKIDYNKDNIMEVNVDEEHVESS